MGIFFLLSSFDSIFARGWQKSPTIYQDELTHFAMSVRVKKCASFHFLYRRNNFKSASTPLSVTGLVLWIVSSSRARFSRDCIENYKCITSPYAAAAASIIASDMVGCGCIVLINSCPVVSNLRMATISAIISVTFAPIM